MTNTVKEKLKAGKKTCGAWSQLCNPMIAEILSCSGLDWVLVDLEHSPSDLMTLVSQLQGIGCGKAVPIVRAPWNDFVVIKRILDAGAMGLVIPYVNTREQAEAAVRACTYPRTGIRGIAGSVRAMGYGGSSADYMKSANQEILVITQIETYEAVENLDEIISVPGIDGFFIGPMDLATSMGFLGNPNTPEVQEVIARVEKKVLGSGKFLGTVTASWEKAEELYKKGYQFLTLMADGILINKTSRELAAKFKNLYSD